MFTSSNVNSEKALSELILYLVWKYHIWYVCTLLCVQYCIMACCVGGGKKPSLLLEIMQTLLSSLQALQVFHHLLHVVLRVAILDVGKPAATHAYDYRHYQHEVL